MRTALIISIISTIVLGIFSCSNKTTVIEPTKNSNPKIEKVTETVDHGLWKIQIDDSTTILIYRGTESCTMIQLK